RVPIVRTERPAMAEHDGLSFAPVFVVNSYSVFGFDVAHIFFLLVNAHSSLPPFNFDETKCGSWPLVCKVNSIFESCNPNSLTSGYPAGRRTSDHGRGTGSPN